MSVKIFAKMPIEGTRFSNLYCVFIKVMSHHSAYYIRLTLKAGLRQASVGEASWRWPRDILFIWIIGPAISSRGGHIHTATGDPDRIHCGSSVPFISFFCLFVLISGFLPIIVTPDSANQPSKICQTTELPVWSPPPALIL